MNNRRNVYHLLIIVFLGLAILSFLSSGIYLLKNWQQKPWLSDIFLGLGTTYLSFVVVCMVFAIHNLVETIKKYNKQYEEYGIDFILANLKRERSALLMVIFGGAFLFPFFVMINAYLKSGLSKKQREFAKEQIKIKNVDIFLNQKSVLKKLQENPQVNKLIEDIKYIREHKYDVVYNCNFFILQKLNEIDAKYEITFNPKDVYYVGMNF